MCTQERRIDVVAILILLLSHCPDELNETGSVTALDKNVFFVVSSKSTLPHTTQKLLLRFHPNRNHQYQV